MSANFARQPANENRLSYPILYGKTRTYSFDYGSSEVFFVEFSTFENVSDAIAGGYFIDQKSVVQTVDASDYFRLIRVWDREGRDRSGDYAVQYNGRYGFYYLLRITAIPEECFDDTDN